MTNRSTTNPAISVVIPVHNRADLLALALDSVRQQRFALAFETIVVDDCSSDDSAAVAEDSAATVIRLNTNVGPGTARNKGIEQARGAWVAFLDSDDVWAADHLQTLWDGRVGVALVASSGLFVVPGGYRVSGSPFLRPVEAARPADILRPENIVDTSGCMVRADVLREVGAFKSQRLSEDLDLWLRVLERHHGRVLPNLTVANRDHPGRTSSINATAMTTETSAVMTAAVAASRVDATARSRVRTTARWDDFRASQRPLSQRIRLLRPSDVGRIALLSWRRFALRHRWRLCPARARLLGALLSAPRSTARDDAHEAPLGRARARAERTG